MYVYGQLLRAAVETLGSDPSTAADKFTGRLWYNTATNLLKYADASGNVKVLTTSGDIVNADINASAAIAYSKLNLSGSIVNADINASAAIAYSKLAALTASRALVSDGSGIVSVSSVTSTELGYVSGVTSAIQTQLDAKQARSTLTTKGDLYVATASATVARQGVGSDGQVLTADSAQTNGIKWATPTTAPDQSYELTNLSLAASISSNILTVALKDKAGSDPSSGSSVKIGFRNATATTGTYSQVTVTGALSLELGTAVSLGLATTVSSNFYIYALNNAGTVEMFASAHPFWDEGRVQSTSTTGTSNQVLYGANARSNMAIRLIGRIKATWTSAVGWSSITNIDLLPFSLPVISAIYTTAAGQTIEGAGAAETVDFGTKEDDPYNTVVTGASWLFTAPAAGVYEISGMVWFNSNAGFAAGETYVCDVRKNSTTFASFTHVAESATTRRVNINIPRGIRLAANDTIDIQVTNNTGTNTTLQNSASGNYISIVRTGA